MYPFTLLAVILGAVIGLSGKVAAKEIGLISRGIRTFALVCLLGALAGALYQEHLTILSFSPRCFHFLISYYIMGRILPSISGDE